MLNKKMCKVTCEYSQPHPMSLPFWEEHSILAYSVSRWEITRLLSLLSPSTNGSLRGWLRGEKGDGKRRSFPGLGLGQSLGNLWKDWGKEELMGDREGSGDHSQFWLMWWSEQWCSVWDRHKWCCSSVFPNSSACWVCLPILQSPQAEPTSCIWKFL